MRLGNDETDYYVGAAKPRSKSLLTPVTRRRRKGRDGGATAGSPPRCLTDTGEAVTFWVLGADRARRRRLS